MSDTTTYTVLHKYSTMVDGIEQRVSRSWRVDGFAKAWQIAADVVAALAAQQPGYRLDTITIKEGNL